MRLLRQFTCVFVISLIGSVAYAQKDGQKIDVSKIADPKIKAIAEAMDKKQANIRELIVKETHVMFENDKPQLTEKSTIMERLPDKYYKRTITYEGDQQTSDTIYSEEEFFFDGRYRWRVIRNGPVYKGENPKAGEARIYKADIIALKKAGAAGDYLAENRFYRKPVAAFERGNLKLDKETLIEWILSETSQKNNIRHVYHISKLNGLCTKIEILVKNTKIVSALDEILINPNPPLGDSKFKYQPPVGTKVKDRTEFHLKRRLARQGSQPVTGMNDRNSQY